jgi:hypothetical protein
MLLSDLLWVPLASHQTTVAVATALTVQHIFTSWVFQMGAQILLAFGLLQ